MTRVLFLLPFLALLQAKPNDWPFPSHSRAGGLAPTAASPTPAPSSTPPPYDVALRQESWEKLSDQEISRVGQEALALRPQQWRHGETENFIFHYRGHPLNVDPVERLYDTSANFVRYLFNKYPKELFPKFVDHLLGGETAATALPEVYGDEFRDMNEFEKRFSRFTR